MPAKIAALAPLASLGQSLRLKEDENTLGSNFAEKLEDLYYEILRFLADVTGYFGRSTAKRIIGNLSKSGDWDGRRQTIQFAHQSRWIFLQRIDSQDHQTGINSIKGLMEEQNREIKKLLDDFHVRFHQSEELILRVSKVNVESVHDQLREKLGCCYWNFGQWLRKEYDKWIASDIRAFWLCGSGV
jgi:hypothetical protein